MKWKRWLWAGLGLVLLLPLLGGVHVRVKRAEPWSPALAKRISTYLEANRQALDLDDFRPTLIELSGKRVVLLGEEHGMATMEDLDLAMLRYLHRAAGVRVYLMEIGYAYGCLLNRYLESGDEGVLDAIMRDSARSMAWTKERRAFFAGLRRWNESLPASDRLRVVGVDVEHQRILALSYLDELAPNRSMAAPEIREILAKLGPIQSERDGRIVAKFIRELAGSVAAHRPAYAALLGDRLFDFELVTGNLVHAVEFYEERNSPKGFAIRERTMFETFRKVYERMGYGVWYGRFGGFHVYRRRAENLDRFAALLDGPGSPVAGRVASIIPLFSHSEAMGGDYRAHQVDTDAAGSHPFASAAFAGPMTLFRLDAEDSPFRQRVPGFLQGEGVPAELAQYVVLIRNATASHALEP